MIVVVVLLWVGVCGVDFLEDPLPLLGFTYRAFFRLITIVVVGVNSVKR